LSAEASSPEEREAAKRFWDSIQLYTHRERGQNAEKRPTGRKKEKKQSKSRNQDDETEEDKQSREIQKQLFHRPVPHWVMATMKPQLEKIFAETKLAKMKLKKEKREKDRTQPEPGFLPTEMRRKNIGICQVCPIIGPKSAFPILTFDNLGRPNGRNLTDKLPKAVPSPYKSQKSIGAVQTDLNSDGSVKSDAQSGGANVKSNVKTGNNAKMGAGKAGNDVRNGAAKYTNGGGSEEVKGSAEIGSEKTEGFHWWTEQPITAPEDEEYDHEGIGARMEDLAEIHHIEKLGHCLTRTADGKFTCDNIKERRKDY